MEINYINGEKNLVDLENNKLQSANPSTSTTTPSATKSTITSTTTTTTATTTTPCVTDPIITTTRHPTPRNFNISTTPIVSTTTTTTRYPTTPIPININKKFVQINNSAYWNQDTIYKVNNNKSMAFVTYNDSNVIYLMGKYYGGNISEENLGTINFTYTSYSLLEYSLIYKDTPGFYKFTSSNYAYSHGTLKVVKNDFGIYKEVNVSLQQDQNTLFKMSGYAFNNNWFWEINQIFK